MDEFPLPIALRRVEEAKRMPWWRRWCRYSVHESFAPAWGRLFDCPADYFDQRLTPRVWPEKLEPFASVPTRRR